MTELKRRGFTLIELIIFIVVVGVGLAGIFSVVSVVVKSSADPMVRRQAMAMADSIMEEILLKAYAGSATACNADHTLCDVVSDYNGLTQTAFTDFPPELSRYVIAITVGAPASVSTVDMKQVTVIVSRGDESISMTGYRADY